MLRAFVVIFLTHLWTFFLLFLFDVESCFEIDPNSFKKERGGEKEGGMVEIDQVLGGEIEERGQLSLFEVVKCQKSN
jgi:hypothetical protein